MREFSVGDVLVSVYARLERPDGSPVILGVTETVAFRMVNTATNAVKVADKPAIIVNRGSANLPACIRYDWDAADIDTAGSYAGWFIRQLAGGTEHFPPQKTDDANVEFEIIVRPVT
jgi:hypothetical protein